MFLDDLLDLKAKWNAYVNKRNYEKAIKESKSSALLMTLLPKTQAAWDSIMPHPLMASLIPKFKLSIATSPKMESVNFGDSLTAMAYEWIDEVDGKFAISGSWHKHIHDVAEELYNDLKDKDVKYVMVGTLGGNPMLVAQDFDATIEYSLKTLNRIRNLFPKSKLIVYGLPPVYSVSVNVNTIQFDLRLYDWVLQDGNSVFISLKDKMGGFFPKAKWSNDGVHLNPRGARLLNKLFKKAKQTTSRWI